MTIRSNGPSTYLNFYSSDDTLYFIHPHTYELAIWEHSTFIYGELL